MLPAYHRSEIWRMVSNMQSYWKVAVAVATMLGVATPATAEVYTLNIAPSAAQTSRYDRGMLSIDSVQRATAVRVENVPGNDKKSVSFVIRMANAAGQRINFGPENITIRDSGMKPIALTTYDQAMAAERRKQSREKFWAGVAAAGRGLSAADAGTSYNSGVYSGSASGYVGNNLVTTHTNGIYNATQYDSGRALAAQRQAREMNAEERSNLEAKWAARSSAHRGLLRTTTVNPGAMCGGVVTFPIGKDLKTAKEPVHVTIEVNVAGERHLFIARLSTGG
jgi:hypothetical protein